MNDSHALVVGASSDIGRAVAAELAALGMSVNTLKTHVKAILGKLDAISRTEAVAVAAKRGLIRLS